MLECILVKHMEVVISERDSNEIIRIDASMTLEEHLLLNAVLEIENNTSINYQGSLDELYLTRLAIATMENTISTQVYYNSMQRRDVVEALELAERTDANRITSTLITEELTSTANTTLQAVTETTTAKVIKTIRKKVSLVGRPKTYNMEELTDFDEKTESKWNFSRIITYTTNYLHEIVCLQITHLLRIYQRRKRIFMPNMFSISLKCQTRILVPQ